MYGNQPVGASQTMPPPANDQPPSYASVLHDIQTEQARFSSLTTIVEAQTVSLIQTMSEEHQFQPKKLAKSLVDHLIAYFDLTDTQLPPTGNSNICVNDQNPIEPNLWNWVDWESQLYRTYTYSDGDQLRSIKNSKILEQIEIRIDVHFSQNYHLFTRLKHLTSVKESIGAWSLEKMVSFLEIKEVLRHNCLPVTPIIQDCIRAGFFPRALIDDLYKMAIPDSIR